MEIDKAYYLHEEELAILLSLYAQEELYGYPLHSISNIKMEDVYQGLYKMINRGILYVSDEALHIKEPWKSIIRQMIKARTLIVCADSNEKHEELFLYVSDRTVAVHTQGINHEIVWVTLWNNDTVAYRILRHGIQLESFMESGVGETKLSIEEQTSLSKKAGTMFSKPFTEKLKEKNVLFLLTSYDISAQKKVNEIIALHHGIEDYLITFGVDGNGIYAYSEKTLQSLVNEWVEGGK